MLKTIKVKISKFIEQYYNLPHKNEFKLARKSIEKINKLRIRIEKRRLEIEKKLKKWGHEKDTM